MTEAFFSRAGQSGPKDLAKRVPELAALRSATIAAFGLGCLGAPSVLEFARCGTKKLYLVDYDIVDPATVCRWPFGLSSAGLHKVAVLSEAIKRDYPFTQIDGWNFAVGAVRSPDEPGESMLSVMDKLLADASLIYDATAEIGVQHYLSDAAADLGIPYVGVSATPGAWGGTVVAIQPGKTDGCWYCYRCALDDMSIPEPPMNPTGEVQPIGCAEPTFTGPGFDLVQVALAGVRSAVSTLCGPSGGYPNQDWDVTTIALRSADGKIIPPLFQGFPLKRHDKCSSCKRK